MKERIIIVFKIFLGLFTTFLLFSSVQAQGAVQIESEYDTVVLGYPAIFIVTDNTNGDSVFLQYRDPQGNMKDIGWITENSNHTARYIFDSKGMIPGTYIFYAWDISRTNFDYVSISLRKPFITVLLLESKSSYAPGDLVRLTGMATGQEIVTLLIEEPGGIRRQIGTAKVTMGDIWGFSWIANGTQSGLYKIYAIGSDPDSDAIFISFNFNASTQQIAPTTAITQVTPSISNTVLDMKLLIIAGILIVGSIGTALFIRSRSHYKSADAAVITKLNLTSPNPDISSRPQIDRLVSGEKSLIFISSKSEDYHYAQMLYNFLISHETNVFFSKESLPMMGNADYREEIDKAIDRAKHMIVVGSSVENIESPWVKAEWGAFIIEKRSGRKPESNLITVITDSVKIDALPISLRMNEVIPFDPEKFSTILKYLA